MIINGMRTIAPSKISPWEGTPVEGSPFTRQQIDVARRERPRWSHFHTRSVALSAPATGFEPPEQVTVYCPILAWTKDKARVLIVTPAGDKQWVKAEKHKRPPVTLPDA